MNHKAALIVHPDADIRRQMERFLSDSKCDVNVVDNASWKPEHINGNEYRLALIHEDMTASDGQNICDLLLNGSQTVPVIILSDLVDVRKAVKAVQNGALDYFTQGCDEQALRASLKRALKLTAKNGRPGKGSSALNDSRTIVSRSGKMNRVLTIAERVAKAGATVLIEGESGTGKELLARFIHHHSGRSKKPFIAMNCAALPESLAESELFGYGKGAFTGATKSRIGKFEQAQGGTLMLDDISEMPLSLQVKLLRVLQEKEVDPIGGRNPVPVDVRVVATCNRELAKMVKDGTFRQDLYYRLRVIPLTIPPLRERTEDIPLLVEHFFEKFISLHQTADLTISPEAMVDLANWSWPGNVRELENTIERATLICDGKVIQPAHLLIDADVSALETVNTDPIVGMTVKEIEKKLIHQTLQHVNENRTHAAEMLGISIRTLRNKLREYAQSREPDPQSAFGNSS